MDAVPLQFDDKNLMISFDTWNLLKQNAGTNVYESIRAAAKGTIERGGAFIIYIANHDIWKRCDYLHELNEVLDGR